MPYVFSWIHSWSDYKGSSSLWFLQSFPESHRQVLLPIPQSPPNLLPAHYYSSLLTSWNSLPIGSLCPLVLLANHPSLIPDLLTDNRSRMMRLKAQKHFVLVAMCMVIRNEGEAWEYESVITMLAWWSGCQPWCRSGGFSCATEHIKCKLVLPLCFVALLGVLRLAHDIRALFIHVWACWSLKCEPYFIFWWHKHSRLRSAACFCLFLHSHSGIQSRSQAWALHQDWTHHQSHFHIPSWSWL